MVARAWGERGDAKRLRPAGRTSKRVVRAAKTAGGIEERFVQNDAVSVCLLLNRRTKTMRVIDFRAGPSHAKRIFVLDLAKREGIEKVYTLVERDEVSTWTKLGFSREASIPCFYKRSDAFLLGSPVDESTLKLHFRPFDGDDEDDEEDEVEAKPSAALEIAEKTVAQARKQVKALDRQLPPVKLAPLKEGEVRKAVDRALRSGRALTGFEHFGRDIERRYFALTARGGFELVASVESQTCFGNGFLELLTSPATEPERLATISAVRTICDKLMSEGTVSCFSLAPSDDVSLATAFLFSGFRRTGLLLGHMRVGDECKDAIVWSRKLAAPTEA